MLLDSRPSPADPLALDPLSPTGFSPVERISTTDPLALDPLSPVPTAAGPIDAVADQPASQTRKA